MAEINEQIALLLGFEKIPAKPQNGIHFVQWRYPEEWRWAQWCTPVTDVPDFAKMLSDAKSIYAMTLHHDRIE